MTNESRKYVSEKGDGDGAGEEEDEYLSMVIEEPKAQIKETSIQRRARKQREAGNFRVHLSHTL